MRFNALKSGASSFLDRFTRKRRDPAAYSLEKERKLDRAYGRAALERDLDFIRSNIFWQ